MASEIHVQIHYLFFTNSRLDLYMKNKYVQFYKRNSRTIAGFKKHFPSKACLEIPDLLNFGEISTAFTSKKKFKPTGVSRKPREFTLATISVLTEIKANLFGPVSESSKSQVSALDALSFTGVCGVQWKKNLPETVRVTLADPADVTVMSQNAEANSLACEQLKLIPGHTSSDVNRFQAEKEIHVCQADARTIMTMEAFNFIYLNPTKNITTYFEPAFSSLTSNGLLCFIFPDVSLFARTPHVVKRYLDANVVKTEYLKELASRIIIASLARCAARFNKGIIVNYVVSNEDNVLICVQVLKGHAAADASIATLANLLHCRLCEQRNFIPQQLAPIDDPYGLLHCNCKTKNPGKTAVLLGPMWKGPIFSSRFLNLLHKHGGKLKLSTKFFEITNLLVAECLCPDNISPRTTVQSSEQSLEDSIKISPKDEEQSLAKISPKDDKEQSLAKISPKDDKEQSLAKISPKDDEEQSLVKISPKDDEQQSLAKARIAKDSIQSEEEFNATMNIDKDTQSVTTPLKRKATNSKSPILTKKPKTDCEDVSFYYNISKFRRTNIPKLDKLVTILHCQGHRASRTHFDHSAIRTSANVVQFLSALS